MASLSNPALADPIQVTARLCVGRATFTLPAATVKTLAEVAGGSLPAGAVAARIQADGGVIRITSDGATNPSNTVGFRIDDGVFYDIDTALSAIKVLSQAGCTIQAKFYDRV